MALELRQQLKLSQQLIMTPQLQMAIKLLQLSRLELIESIEQELSENPALEESVNTAENSENETLDEGEGAGDLKEVTIDERLPDDIDWSNYIGEYNTPGKMSFEVERKEYQEFEAYTSEARSLNDHLLWQFLMVSPTETEEKISSQIIGNLNRNGYLEVSLEEIAASGPFPISEVERTLAILQSLDPPGICARDLKESLLIQAKLIKLDNSLVTDIITNHLKDLENGNYEAICSSLGIKKENLAEAIKIIQSFDPRPGQLFFKDVPRHIIPDIYVYKSEGRFMIVLNDNGLPKLRISNFYRRSLNENGDISEKVKTYIQERMRSATWFIKSIHQRQKTIYRVMESILNFQRLFFEKGIAYLKPMVLRDVAEHIGMHESTISRVTTNKYVHTPQGIFELKYFFNSSIRCVDGDEIASESVKESIKRIISGEDPVKPYSDKKITDLLKENNIRIARRTIAKYREALGILPSGKRKRLALFNG